MLRRLAPLLPICLLAATVGLAGAATTPPDPSSCGGIAFTDPAGDATYKVDVVGPPVPAVDTGQAAPDNHDVLGGFFRDSTLDGVEHLTMNVQVANLDQSVAVGADAVGIWTYFTVGAVQNFVVGYSDGKAWTYKYGHNTANGYSIDGPTTGANYDGKKGVLAIDVPIAKFNLAGATITKPYSLSTQITLGKGDPVFGSDPISYTTVDTAPDTGEGKSFAVTPCAEAGQPTEASPTAPTTAPAPTTRTPPQQSGQAVAPSPQPGAPTTAPPSVRFKVTVGKLSARKLKPGKTIAVKVQASAPVTKLTAALRRGKKIVAKGTLAALHGTQRMKLQVSAKKLKAGTYVLALKATSAAGKPVTGFVNVSVKK